MATKKQKRAAGIAKREKFMAEIKASGLEAQRLDRERREAQKRDEWDSIVAVTAVEFTRMKSLREKPKDNKEQATRKALEQAAAYGRKIWEYENTRQDALRDHTREEWTKFRRTVKNHDLRRQVLDAYYDAYWEVTPGARP